MHANPAGQFTSAVHPVEPPPQTPGQSPPQPSLGLAHVADEQSGVQTQVEPQSASGRPQSAESLDGHRGSTHASAMGASKSLPAVGLHTSPAGQLVPASVGSQEVKQAQLLPQALVALPHAFLLPPPSQVGLQHTRVARARAKHAPLFWPHKSPVAQSLSLLQFPPGGHGHSGVHVRGEGGVHRPA